MFGLTLLMVVLGFAPYLHDFYSDDGILPRWAELQYFARAGRFSVFDAAGNGWSVAALYATTVVAICSMIVGYRTRTSTVLSFILVSGLFERNELVLDGSDDVCRVFLFWLMFIPSGAQYSVDAWVRRRRGELAITHHGALPIRLAQFQVGWIYCDAVIHKWQGSYWHDGTALSVALGLEHLFARPLGSLLAREEWFIRLGTDATMLIEASFLPLIFLPLQKPPGSNLPRWLFQPTYKALAIISGTSLHLGIAMLMRVGNFSQVMISTYFILFEAEWTTSVVSAITRAPRVAIPARMARAFPNIMITWTKACEARYGIAWLRDSGRRLMSLALVLLMVSCMWYGMPDKFQTPSFNALGLKVPSIDLSSAALPDALFNFVTSVEMWQRWNMFSPFPFKRDEYLVGPGTLTDGSTVDVLRPATPGHHKVLPGIDENVFFSRWTKYTLALMEDKPNSPKLQEFGRYLCRRWESVRSPGAPQLDTFRLYKEWRLSRPIGQAADDWHERVLWEHHCLAEVPNDAEWASRSRSSETLSRSSDDTTIGAH